MKKEEVRIKVFGMTCDDCALTIEKSLKVQDGVIDANISFKSKEGKVLIDTDLIKPDDVLRNQVFLPKSRYKAILEKE